MINLTVREEFIKTVMQELLRTPTTDMYKVSDDAQALSDLAFQAVQIADAVLARANATEKDYELRTAYELGVDE